MKRDARVYLEDILESIVLIEEYVKGVSESDFNTDTGTQDKVVRRLEVIGEAVKNLPQEFREKHPDTPWKQIAGMRDMLTHEYFNVKIRRVWKVVEKDLPKLKTEAKSILASE
jgi:uncharacterized protein with HEPN domain